MVRPEVKQRSLILRFTDALGLTGAPETESSPPAQDNANDIRGLPQVSSGSTLALMVQMNLATASTYTDAVTADLSKCISTFQVDSEGFFADVVLEQIHSLKNVIAATGSLQLIAACEAMRLDACRRTSLGTLEARYKAVGNAAIQAVTTFMRSTTPTLSKGDRHSDSRH